MPRLFEWRELAGAWPDQPQGRTLREIVARGQGLAIMRVEARRLELDDFEVQERVSALPQPDFDANRPHFASGKPRTKAKRRPRGGVRERERKRKKSERRRRYPSNRPPRY